MSRRNKREHKFEQLKSILEDLRDGWQNHLDWLFESGLILESEGVEWVDEKINDLCKILHVETNTQEKIVITFEEIEDE